MESIKKIYKKGYGPSSSHTMGPHLAAEISAEGSSIYEYDPKGKAASAYKALTEEVACRG